MLQLSAYTLPVLLIPTHTAGNNDAILDREALKYVFSFCTSKRGAGIAGPKSAHRHLVGTRIAHLYMSTSL